MSNSHTIFRLAPYALLFLAACGGSESPEKLPVSEPKADDAGRRSTADEAGSGGTAGQHAQEPRAGSGSAGRAGAPAAEGGSKAPQPPAAGKGGAGGSSGAGGSKGGSGGSAGDDAPPAEVDRDSIAAGLAGALCDALEKCVGPAKLAALSGREDCRERYNKSFRQDEFGTLQASISAGTVKVDPGQLDTCYRDTRALGCAVHADRLPASCQAAIAGQQQAGEICSLDADCAAEHFCPIGEACPRECQPLRAAAESCERDAECRRGLLCTNAKCAAPSKAGEACAGNGGKVCTLGLSCVGSDNVTAGKCQANSSVQSGALNAVCTPGGTLCKEGLSCAHDGASGFKCQAAVAKGATCRLALPSQCPIDTYCDAADVTATGTCLALPVDGEACVLGDDCAPGHICVVNDDQSAICHRIADLDEPCAADQLCRSGVCDTKCALRERCE